jgi:nicotinamidase-related amidase
MMSVTDQGGWMTPMPAKNEDLHGFVPDKSEVALLIIDMVNDFEFPGGEEIFEQTLPIVDNIVQLKERAKEAGIPTIYVNDNYGKWQSNFGKLVRHSLGEVRGRPIAEKLKPDDEDYFILKPKHSGFHSTALDTLLDYLKVKTLILTGTSAASCVLFTANDAYIRDFFIYIPQDCIASNKEEDTQHALYIMRNILKADTTPHAKLNLKNLKS